MNKRRSSSQVSVIFVHVIDDLRKHSTVCRQTGPADGRGLKATTKALKLEVLHDYTLDISGPVYTGIQSSNYIEFRFINYK